MANREPRGRGTGRCRGRRANADIGAANIIEPNPPASAQNVVQPLYQPRYRDPPIFRGTAAEDVVNRVFRFEQIADYNNWNPGQRLRQIGICFEGVAEKWYCGLMTRARPPATLDALRQ